MYFYRIKRDFEIIFEIFGSSLEPRGALGALFGAFGRYWGLSVRFGSNLGAILVHFGLHFGSILDLKTIIFPSAIFKEI